MPISIFHPLAEVETPARKTALSFDSLLAPVFETARDSASLLTGRHTVQVGGRAVELPNFLLLGQRGGGHPVRVGLFSGLDAESEETVLALSRLLLQFELSPRLAQDFAVFAYPIVNAFGFARGKASLAEFERRFAADREVDGDVQFFRRELAKWSFDGVITLRVDRAADGFYAVHRSAVLGKEVVAPALEAISPGLPLRANARVWRPDDRGARLADIAHGRLSAAAGGPPYPFEIELFAPGRIGVEQRVTGLFLLVQEVLRNYRRLIAHAANL
jgi:hypothetical protein